MVRGIIMLALFFGMRFWGSSWVASWSPFNFYGTFILIYSILGLAGLVLYGSLLKKEWGKLRQRERPIKFFLTLLAWSILAVIITISWNLLVSKLFDVEIVTHNQEAINMLIGEIPIFLSYLIICVFAPFIEEMTFRQSFMGWPRSNQKLLLAVMTLASIIVFDAIHISKPVDFLFYLPISLIICLFYWRQRRNPWPSIFLHSMFNTFGFIMIVIGMKLD